MTDKKIGTYICTGCGIGDALDIEALSKIATDEFKVGVCRNHNFLCSKEGVKLITDDIKREGIDTAIIAACSARYCWDVFNFGEAVHTERVNIREHVAWVFKPKDEDTQMAAEDYLRMGITKANLTKPVNRYIPEAEVSKDILVVGGGVAGMTAALEAAKAGYKVHLVEKEKQLGGFAAKLYKEFPTHSPYTKLEDPGVQDLIDQVKKDKAITVHVAASLEKIEGAPGLFDVTIKEKGKNKGFRIGAIVQATGFKPYDASKIEHLGYGKHKNIVTGFELEEMAKNNSIKLPSNDGKVQSIAFILCAGSRDENHLPYCSTVCCMNSLKQALYIREKYPEAKIYIFYKDIRTPGQYENFYSKIQEDPGIFLTKGDVVRVAGNGENDLVVEVDNTLLGEKIKVKVNMAVLATGMVPVSGCEESPLLHLEYRQGPDLPELEYGFPDSHFICFPYETRRTGIYAAGCVRNPMDIASAREDAAGAAMKAIQNVEMTAKGEAVHPRGLDITFPEFFMQKCTQCKRCTEECPFGTLNEDAKGTPLENPTRCRRCGICLGACPEKIISFADFSVNMIAKMIKCISMPEEDEEKPRVLAFFCENDAYPGLDMLGMKRIGYSPYIRIIPVRCLGSVNIVWMADALSAGFDAILLIGCKSGDDYQCHYIKGSELAGVRMDNVQETLQKLMLERERISIKELPMNEYHKIPEYIEDIMEVVEEYGPNPFKDL